MHLMFLHINGLQYIYKRNKQHIFIKKLEDNGENGYCVVQ